MRSNHQSKLGDLQSSTLSPVDICEVHHIYSIYCRLLLWRLWRLVWVVLQKSRAISAVAEYVLECDV